MDDLTPAPAGTIEQGETTEPRTPSNLFALKDKDTFLVADAFGDVLGAPTACSTTTPACCRACDC